MAACLTGTIRSDRRQPREQRHREAARRSQGRNGGREPSGVSTSHDGSVRHVLKLLRFKKLEKPAKPRSIKDNTEGSGTGSESKFMT